MRDMEFYGDNMKISNKKKHADIPKSALAGAMKEYKKNPGSINAAVFAAAYKAKQMKSDIIVIEGNSMGHRVYHLALPNESLKKYTVMSTKANVVVVTQKGEAFMATAQDTKNESLVEKYLDEVKGFKGNFGIYEEEAFKKMATYLKELKNKISKAEKSVKKGNIDMNVTDLFMRMSNVDKEDFFEYFWS